jgi:hypothetical protein
MTISTTRMATREMSTLGSILNLDGAGAADLLFIEALCGIRPLNIAFCLGGAEDVCAIAETLRCLDCCDAE